MPRNEEVKEDVVFEDVEQEEAPDMSGIALHSANSESNAERTEDDIQSDIKQIEALAKIDPSIKEMDEYKNLVDLANESKGDDVEYEDEDEDEDVEYEDEDVEYEDEDEDVFGITRASQENYETFEISDDVADFIEDHYGIEKVDTFFDSVDKWRTQAQKATETTEEYEDLLDGIQSLPQEIKDAITAYANAEDYHEAFGAAGGRLNYNNSFKDQKKESVVQHYFKDEVKKLNNKLDEGDIDDIDYDDRVEMLYSSSKRLFEQDQKVFNERRADLQAEQEVNYKAFKESVSSSVYTLKEEFPNFSNKDLNKIRKHLVDGTVGNLFYNEDGTYTDDAATMLAMALYGGDVMQDLLEEATAQGESEANKRMVKRGNRRPRSGGTQQAQSSEAINAVSHLNSSFSSDPYS